MLQKLSDEGRECHERAAEARRKAEAADNPAWKAEFLDIERRWLALARSCAFAERLEDFTAENSKRLRELDELRRASDGAVVAMHASEDRLRWLASIVEFSDDAIVGKTLDGIITSWNTGAERIFGYSADEVIGKSITILIPADRPDEETGILRRIGRGERIDQYETIRRRKDGSLITVSLTISPVKDGQGKIVGASKIARDITERKRSEEQIAMLAREAEHRTKNILATVQAAVQLSHADTADALKRAIEGRIAAIAKVHTLFVQSRWTGAELFTIAVQELEPYGHGGESRTHIEGPPLLLVPTVAQTMAMTLHELATNAAKYGALSVATGRVAVKWLLTPENRFVLDWTEMGGPPVASPAHRGFGTRVIEQMIVGQLDGTVRADWRAEGLACEIAFPFAAEHGSRLR